MRASIVEFWASRYIIGLNRTSESKLMAFWIFFVLPCLISSISIYYAPESASEWNVVTIWISRELLLFNFERLNIILAWIGHSSQKLWLFEFPCVAMFNFVRLHTLCAWIEHPSEKLWPYDFLENFCCSISGFSINYCPESNIQVKSYGRLNLPCAAMVNFEHLDILCAWIGTRGKSYEHLNFSRAFIVQFWASHHIIGLNRTSKSKVMAVWICLVLPCLI